MIRLILSRGFLTVILLLLSSRVMSEEISFEYVQASFISDTIDLQDSTDEIEGSGIGFLISLGFDPAFSMTLAVSSTTFDTYQGQSVDTTKSTSLGVTAHTSVYSGTDVFTNISAVKAEITANNGVDKTSDSDIGGIASVGIRHLLTDNFEVEIGLSYNEVFDYALTSQKVDARLYVWRRLSVGVGYVANDDVESLAINARMDI